MAKHSRKNPVRAAPRPKVRSQPERQRGAPPPRDDGAGWLAWTAGFVTVAALGGAFFGWSAGCKHEPPPGATPSSGPLPAPVGVVAGRVRSPPDAGTNGNALASDPNKPYDGPLIGSLVTQAPIYVGMEAYRDKRIGYIRHGGKAPVDPTPIKSPNCEAGWYHLLGGGYVCGKFATLDLNNPQVRLGTTPPNLDDVLPYHYAWNTTMGTPLYKAVPSREDMVQYEPYLKAQAKRRSDSDIVENPYAGGPGGAPEAPDGGALSADEKPGGSKRN
jgi:hypothetical protein